jgi:hypothetical protein
LQKVNLLSNFVKDLKMKNLDLNVMGVVELNHQEMMNVESGNIFKKIGEALETAWEAVTDALETADKWLKARGICIGNNC